MQAPTAPAAGMTHSPIAYRGGPLKYTDDTDYPMRAIKVTMQYLQELASQHGELLTLSKTLSGVIGRSESGVMW